MAILKQEIEKSGFLKKALEVRKSPSHSADEHNLEFVAQINGASYINDSISFSVATTKRSLESFETNVILIIGGFDINTDYSLLSEVIKKKVVAVIYLGKETEKIVQHSKSDQSMLFVSATSLQQAIQAAYFHAIPGDVVLFSPACSSGKEYADYKIRGTEYKRLVNELTHKKD